MSENKRCGLCQFYTVNPNNVRQGICHRFPPNLVFIGINTNGAVTQMFYTAVDGKDDWCGEFAPCLELMA